MAATYDDSLATDRDRVRYLIGDTDTSAAGLSDNEIDWELTEQSNVYLAAARCLSNLYTRWTAKGKGYASKRVDELAITFGMNAMSGASEDVVRARIAELRQRGTPSPSVLKVL